MTQDPDLRNSLGFCEIWTHPLRNSLVDDTPWVAPFVTVGRVRKLAEPTYDPAVVADTAMELYRGLEDDRPVRLLGVRGEMVAPEGGYER